MASSSSSSVHQKYQVFISFRGEDTRVGFTSHLHKALTQNGIDTFVDYRLEKGEKIETLFTVIEESTISIIVLSKNYGSSSWCLDELSKILECMEKDGQKVVPIFYHVDPSDVRKQRGSFAEAFAEHVKNRPDKVGTWRAALKEVADISGFHLTGKPNDRLESKIVEEIAQKISKKLACKSFVDTKGLVGIDSRVEKIESLLCFDSKDVRIIGIWGMGGIGKTTIAEAVYERFAAKFDGYCFVKVTEELRYGPVHLRQKLFSEILGDKNLNVATSLLSDFIIDRLQRKKVFIVLDDVNNSKQLDVLSIKFGIKFGPGSRIIVTSRDKQLLETVGVRVKHVKYVMFEVRRLIDDEALRLFSLCAFGQKHPKKDFVELSKEVVHYVKGVPLALKVIGSSLYGKNTIEWKGDLEILKEIPNPEIEEVLKISFDGLNKEAQEIFLDIACVCNYEEHRGYVEELLDRCYISPTSGITNLINRSLLSISNDKIKMHDLLRQMALNIIRQDPNKPGKRRRLCTPKDICHILENNTGTESIEVMLLDMSKIIQKVGITPTAFARMKGLRFLKFYYSDSRIERKVFLEKGVESFPGVLSYLHWDEYPLKSLPSNFCAESLVELKMLNSAVDRLWDGVQNLMNLKYLNLKDSQYLIKIPDLSNAINLKTINLDGCKKLENFQSSVGWRSLETLSLDDCSNITKFPEIPENLWWLSLRGTAIEEVPSSIGRVSRLWLLDLSDCRRLERLPSSICKLKSLQILYLQGCLKLKSFPEISETMESLKYLCLSDTSIEELHSSIENLVHLSSLVLDYCEKLKNLPSSIRELKSLDYLSLINCTNVNKFLEIPLNISRLNLRGTLIEQLPSSIDKLLQLHTLDLRYCERLQSLPPELPPNLYYLDASGCQSLKEVSSAFPINLHKHQVFMFINCLKLDQSCINWVKIALSIQHKATKDVNRYHEEVKVYNEDDDEDSDEDEDYVDCEDYESDDDEDSDEDKDYVDHEDYDSNEDDDEDSVENYDKNYHDDYVEEPNLKSSLCIYFPGSEIPEWFSYKSQGSSMAIQLPPHLHDNNKFVGFAVCAVLTFTDDFNDCDITFRNKYFCLSCRYNFKTNSFNEEVFNEPIRGSLDLGQVSVDSRSIVGDHVFLGYDLVIYHCWYNAGSKHHLTEASFEFSFSNSYKDDLSDNFVVKECGVCLLYVQDDFPHRPSEFSYDPTQLSL